MLVTPNCQVMSFVENLSMATNVSFQNLTATSFPFHFLKVMGAMARLTKLLFMIRSPVRLATISRPAGTTIRESAAYAYCFCSLSSRIQR